MGTSAEIKISFQKAVILVILLAGCSRLPDYGQPHIYPGDGSLPAHVISYRNLTVADFQAAELPAYVQEHRQKLNAHTAVAIRMVPGAKYILSTANTPTQQRHFCRVENLAFEAAMIPEHSWWNPALAKEKEEFVLQHEQIHFALMEVAARRLTRRIVKEQERLTVYDHSNESAKKRLLDIINQWLAESQEDVLREQTNFDEDTSRLYAPNIQQWWYERVTTELMNIADGD